MELAQQMNEIIECIESRITEKIDYAELSKIAGCSTYNLQRLFSYINNVSIADYIRYRRMSLAAAELQESDIKIIDLAIKYGYDSPESFTRAFQSFHNISPSSMRKLGTQFMSFPKISYQMIIRGGLPNTEVSTVKPEILTELTFKESYDVLGIENKKSELIYDPKCVSCWDEFFQAKAYEKINPYRKGDGDLGVFCSSEPGYWNYLIGAVVDKCESTPKGMYLRRFPASKYVIVTHEPVASHAEAMTQLGRLVGYAHGGGWQCPEGYERYFDPIMFIESYPPPDENGNHRVELWIPIKQIEDK